MNFKYDYSNHEENDTSFNNTVCLCFDYTLLTGTHPTIKPYIKTHDGFAGSHERVNDTPVKVFNPLSLSSQTF